MSKITEELADRLARDVLAAAEDLEDDQLINQIAEVISATSPSTEEAFRTAVRVRLAEARARKFLEERMTRGKGTSTVTKSLTADQ